MACRRVHHVVGADHQHHVGALELGIDLLEIEELLVRHVGLGEQHVHVAGHPTGDRVDRVLHVDAALGEHVGQLARGVLGLRHRHAVAGDDHHRLDVGEQHARILDADLAHELGRAARRATAGRGRAPPPTPAKSTLVMERFIALHMSSVSRVPDAPTSVPLMISAGSRSAKPVAATARPVKELSSEITTGMSAPPIGTTIRMPKKRREPEEQVKAFMPPPIAIQAMRADEPEEERGVESLLERRGDGLLHETRQLAEGDQRAPEGQRADHRAEQRRAEAQRIEAARRA